MNSKTSLKTLQKNKPFDAVRNHHSNETAEDYTELIADLILTKGEARIGEIAKSMGISHVTALRSVQRLHRDGYVISQSHQPIQLTEKGKLLAAYAKQRHLLLLEFLKKLGVPETQAAIDVEGMEHHVSEITLKAIEQHMKVLNTHEIKK